MGVLLFTSFTNFTPSSVLELFSLIVLQAGQTHHVVLLLFAIRFKVSVIVLLDMSKAFDSIRHDLMLSKQWRVQLVWKLLFRTMPSC